MHRLNKVASRVICLTHTPTKVRINSFVLHSFEKSQKNVRAWKKQTNLVDAQFETVLEKPKLICKIAFWRVKSLKYVGAYILIKHHCCCLKIYVSSALLPNENTYLTFI